jgi:hypothetical protein
MPAKFDIVIYNPVKGGIENIASIEDITSFVKLITKYRNKKYRITDLSLRKDYQREDKLMFDITLSKTKEKYGPVQISIKIAKNSKSSQEDFDLGLLYGYYLSQYNFEK